MQNNIHLDSLEKMNEAVQKCAQIVGPTMGAAGINVALQETRPPYVSVSNDGASLIDQMQFEDPVERMGHAFIKEATTRSNANSGDGSSTTVVLLAKLLEEGIKARKENNISYLQLKKELDEALPVIEASIDSQTREITVDDIPAVAKIAGESEEIGTVLGEIYRVIGKDGIIHLEGSGTYTTSYSLIEGVRFSGTGYLSPYMAHDEEAAKAGRKETKAIYHKPTILVTKRKISHLNDINPLLGALEAQGQKNLVIFTDDMDSGVAADLINAHKAHVINLLIIKAPVLWKGYVFEDFAKVVGATIVEDATGITFKNLQLDHLGTCDTIICDKDECTVIGIADIADHTAEIAKDESMPDVDRKLRLSWLTTKTAILKLGAKSETELSYLRLKTEDAIHSSRLALKGGVVVGGGVALFNASRSFPNGMHDTIGGRILKAALEAPVRQITFNAGHNPDNIVASINVPFNDRGFNAKTCQIEVLERSGIIDSALIVKGAIRNALGIASTLLTTSSVITLPPPSQEELINRSVMRPAHF